MKKKIIVLTLTSFIGISNAHAWFVIIPVGAIKKALTEKPKKENTKNEKSEQKENGHDQEQQPIIDKTQEQTQEQNPKEKQQ